MLLTSLQTLFYRDLTTLYDEVAAYPKEQDLWIVAQQITNSAGNLALHLIGNLNHFIGKELGNRRYQRDRTFEFQGKDVPRETLLTQIRDTRQMVDEVLSQLPPGQLTEDYPLQVFQEPMTIAFFLIHLQGHLNYHLGQINYHRRLLATQ